MRGQVAAGAIVAALLIGATLAALIVFRPRGAPPAVRPSTPTTLTRVDTDPHRLEVERTPATSVDRLQSVLHHVSAASALTADPRHTAECPSTSRAALPVAPAASSFFCWDDTDATSHAWMPRGLDGSSAMAADLGLRGHRVLATSWTSPHGDARITLTDVTRGTVLPYVDLLPVVPAASATGAPTYHRVGGQGGGIVWLGNYLYLTDLEHGIRVFDLRHVMRAPTTGSYPSALGAAYLLPEIEYMHQAAPARDCDATSDHPPPSPDAPVCFSWMSLDREADGSSLVLGERRQDVAGGRILRYPLDTHLLLPVNSGDRTVHPTEAFAAPVISVGGAISQGGTFYVASSSSLTHGRLYVTAPGKPATATTCGAASTASEHCWSIAPEGLAYWPGLAEIWSLTDAVEEGRTYRIVFAVSFAALPRTP